MKAAKLPSLTLDAYKLFSTIIYEFEKNKLKSSRGLPDSNCEGCHVKYVRGEKVSISFIAHGTLDQVTDVTIDIKEMGKDPEQYILNTMEDINNAHEEFKKSSSEIYIPPQTELSKAISKTVH